MAITRRTRNHACREETFGLGEVDRQFCAGDRLRIIASNVALRQALISCRPPRPRRGPTQDRGNAGAEWSQATDRMLDRSAQYSSTPHRGARWDASAHPGVCDLLDSAPRRTALGSVTLHYCRCGGALSARDLVPDEARDVSADRSALGFVQQVDSPQPFERGRVLRLGQVGVRRICPDYCRPADLAWMPST